MWSQIRGKELGVSIFKKRKHTKRTTGGRKPRSAGTATEYALKLPRDREVVGRVIKPQGASRFLVHCMDGNDRLCSIPKKYKRRFWIRENDVVLVEPWTVQENERGDVVWRYSIADSNKLKERGMLE